MAVFKAVAELNLNGAGFKAGLATAGKQLDKFGADAARNLRSKFGAAFAGIVGVGAFTAAARDVIGYADKIGDLSKKSGVSQKALQQLGHAANMTGTDLDTMVSVIQKIALTQVDAVNGNEKLQKSYARMGVTLEDLKTMRPEDLFFKMGETLEGVQINSQLTSDAFDIMGKTSGNVLPALVDGLKRAADEATRLKLILDDTTLANLQNLDDQLTIAKARSRPLVAGAMMAGLDALEKMMALGESFDGNMARGGRLGSGLNAIAKLAQWWGASSVAKDMARMKANTQSDFIGPPAPNGSGIITDRVIDMATKKGGGSEQSLLDLMGRDKPEVNAWQRIGSQVGAEDLASRKIDTTNRHLKKIVDLIQGYNRKGGGLGAGIPGHD